MLPGNQSEPEIIIVSERIGGPDQSVEEAMAAIDAGFDLIFGAGFSASCDASQSTSSAAETPSDE